MEDDDFTYEMTRGDTYQIPVTVMVAGKAQDLTGCGLAWNAQSHRPNRNFRLSHSTEDGGVVPLTQSGATLGKAVLTLAPQDTNAFGNVRLEMRIAWVFVDASGNQMTLEFDPELTLLIKPNV